MAPWSLAHPLWLCPFRPFFTLALIAGWALMGLWGGFLLLGWPLPAVPGGPFVWHAHELLLGRRERQQRVQQVECAGASGCIAVDRQHRQRLVARHAAAILFKLHVREQHSRRSFWNDANGEPPAFELCRIQDLIAGHQRAFYPHRSTCFSTKSVLR